MTRAVLANVIVACGVMAACGSGNAAGPTTPAPTPSVAPEPSHGGFLHVLQGHTIVTYAIDGATGALRRSATQDVGDAHALAGEPLGRYVYAAFGPRSGPPYWDPSIVAYAPDPRSGSLTTLSEAASDPIWCRGCAAWGRRGAWHLLSASATRVYGIWETGTYHDTYFAYVAHAVGDEGQLGAAYLQEFDEGDDGEITVDVESDLLYKKGRSGLTAHFVEPDGSLTPMGASRLCLASMLSSPTLLVAVRGFLFASDHHYAATGDEYRVCSWEGPRLTPRAAIGLQASLAVAVVPLVSPLAPGTASRSAALVAMRTWSSGQDAMSHGTRHAIRLLAMSEAGDLTLLDSVETTYPRQLLFHPSGRFLYLAGDSSWTGGAPGSLTVYAIDTNGHLALVQTLEAGGGTLAVTAPAVAHAMHP